MRKILIALEDYQEVIALQGLLMKFGWDVKAVRKAILLKDELISFSPDGIIMPAKGQQLNGVQLSEEIRSKTKADIFLIYRDKSDVENINVSCVSGLIACPIVPQDMIRTLALKSGSRKDLIFKRYEKIFGESLVEEDGVIHVKGGGKPGTAASPKSRKKDYGKWLKEVEGAKEADWSVEKLEAFKEERPEQLNPELDVDKQEFVKTLFSDNINSKK